MDTYSEMKKEFEKTHFVAYNRYFIDYHDFSVPFYAEYFRNSYIHTKCIDDKGNTERFFDMWIKDKNKRQYESIGCYPILDQCPPNVYNNWTPYRMEKYEVYTDKPDEINELLKFIKVMCNYHEYGYNKVITWISHMVQKPAELIRYYITLVGEQGCGKSTLIKLIINMLGSEKVNISYKPERDVWGRYNAKMGKSILVNIDGCSKTQLTKAHDFYLNTIIDETITINQDTITYDINSNHRFIITTNNINDVYKDDRNIIIECSNELVGNEEYFERINTLINDIDVMKTLYEYFNNYKLD